MFETESILCPELAPGSAENPHHHKNGSSSRPTPTAATAQPSNNVRQLAQTVGDDWKNRPYYDEAEPCMDKQWRNTVWPFIQEADFSYVVDLAAGHGRNSEKLKQHAKRIHIVDINQENIDFCRKRFAGDPKFTFTRNDGFSLSFLPTGSVSLLYCFDAMVHFDSDVVRAYLKEFKRILQPGGFGFCHHSNYTKNPGGDVHDNPGWRNFMSQSLFAHYCKKEGLIVVKQRVIDWEEPGSDCVTLFRQAGEMPKAELSGEKRMEAANRPNIFNSLDASQSRKPIAPCPIEPAPINRTTPAVAPANSIITVRQSRTDTDQTPVIPQTDTITTPTQPVQPNGSDRQLRPVVVVLGMHRSGTSLLANLLAALGVNLGENLLAADGNNEAGYWEQEEIYKLQDDLLQKLGRRWIGPAGSVPFPDGWWRLPEVQSIKEQLTSVVRHEIGKTNGLWGFKDPRTSRLLPLWKEIFAELGLKPIYLLAIRNPTEVVQSIVKRDEIPASRAELLWLLHNLDAVRDAGDALHCVVDYDRWFTHPREQAEAVVNALGLEWPADDGELLSAITQRVRPELRHNRTPQELSLPLTAKTFAALQSAATSGKISHELQQVEREMRLALSLCEPWSHVVEELTRPVVTQPEPYFSFIENFPNARMEGLGPQASSAVWDALIDGSMQKALFLHPPARLHFRVPDGRRGRLTFAVNIHPHAWNKPNAGGCEFVVSIDNTVRSAVRVDPVNIPSDRRWHECTIEVPENLNGEHEIVFETKAWGNSLDFRWAVWRDPRLTWSPAPPALPKSIFGQ